LINFPVHRTDLVHFTILSSNDTIIAQEPQDRKRRRICWGGAYINSFLLNYAAFRILLALRIANRVVRTREILPFCQ
jgi:hypothetical protein